MESRAECPPPQRYGDQELSTAWPPPRRWTRRCVRPNSMQRLL